MKNQEKIKREKLSFKKTNDKEQTQNKHYNGNFVYASIDKFNCFSYILA